jgi:hypothetical protein
MITPITEISQLNNNYIHHLMISTVSSLSSIRIKTLSTLALHIEIDRSMRALPYLK